MNMVKENEYANNEKMHGKQLLFLYTKYSKYGSISMDNREQTPSDTFDIADMSCLAYASCESARLHTQALNVM